MTSAPRKPLSALLSQILVAYTVERDCEFERRMLQTQNGGARLSLVIWLNLLRFLVDGPVSVRTLASRARAADGQVQLTLGCLNDGASFCCNPENAPVSAVAEASAPIGRSGSRPAAKWQSKSGRS